MLLLVDLAAFHNEVDVEQFTDIDQGRPVDRDDIGITMINSKHCGFADTLSEDDTLAIFPLVGGG